MNEGWLYATVAMAEALLHFICKQEYLLGRKLHPVIAYTLGVLAMMVPFTFWLIGLDQVAKVMIALALWKTIGTAGLSVLVSYGFEAVVDLVWSKKEMTAENDLLKTQVRDGQAKQD
ncbi:MAG: hypothetical protein ACOYZ6_07940 [Chloroflexota bacterium]